NRSPGCWSPWPRTAAWSPAAAARHGPNRAACPPAASLPCSPLQPSGICWPPTAPTPSTNPPMVAAPGPRSTGRTAKRNAPKDRPMRPAEPAAALTPRGRGGAAQCMPPGTPQRRCPYRPVRQPSQTRGAAQGVAEFGVLLLGPGGAGAGGGGDAAAYVLVEEAEGDLLRGRGRRR